MTETRFKYFREQKFKHSFQDCFSPFAAVEKVNLKLVLIVFFTVPERLARLNFIKNTDMSILQVSNSKFTSVLLFRHTSFYNNKNAFILNAIINNIISKPEDLMNLYSIVSD